MALHNEILTGRINRFLQKLLAMKGRPPAPQLSSEISTNIQLFNGIENRYLEGWRIYMAGSSAGPTVGQTEASQLSNPKGSNVVAIIEALSVIGALGGAAQAFIISENFANQAALTNSGVGVTIDPRVGPPGQISSTLIVSSSAGGSADLGFVLKTVPILSGGFQESISTPNQEITLLPGQSIRVRQNTVNLFMQVNYKWRERPLEESELV